MKYTDHRARALYFSRMPDDECGSVFGLGWAGLYLLEGAGADVLEYEKDGAMLRRKRWETDGWGDHWDSLCQKLELSGEPEMGDIVIEEERAGEYTMAPDGGRFDTRWLALHHAIENYGHDHPPIWFRNRRNVFVLVSEEELESFLRDL